MKKSLRFFLICTISIAVVFSIFSISNAQTSTELNMDDLLTVDDDSSQTTQTDSNNEINNQTQNSTDDVPVLRYKYCSLAVLKYKSNDIKYPFGPSVSSTASATIV